MSNSAVLEYSIRECPFQGIELLIFIFRCQGFCRAQSLCEPCLCSFDCWVSSHLYPAVNVVLLSLSWKCCPWTSSRMSFLWASILLLCISRCEHLVASILLWTSDFCCSCSVASIPLGHFPFFLVTHALFRDCSYSIFLVLIHLSLRLSCHYYHVITIMSLLFCHYCHVVITTLLLSCHHHHVIIQTSCNLSNLAVTLTHLEHRAIGQLAPKSGRLDGDGGSFRRRYCGWRRTAGVHASRVEIRPAQPRQRDRFHCLLGRRRWEQDTLLNLLFHWVFIVVRL